MRQAAIPPHGLRPNVSAARADKVGNLIDDERQWLKANVGLAGVTDTPRDIHVPVRLTTGEMDGFVVVTQDVTDQKRESLRLLGLSRRDPLTRLLNRAGFEPFLERHRLEGGGESLAPLHVDLDG